MQDTKRARIIRLLKQQVLAARNGVSRGAVAAELDIDLRTAAAYLEQLTASRLLRSEKVVSGSKGRPCTIYWSNADRLCFAGLRISSTLQISLDVIDAQGRVLVSDHITLNPQCSRLSAFNTILELVRKYRQVEERSLYGIGLAISRWLQPPLAGEDVYANLADFLSREIGVGVYRDVIINMMAFALTRQLNCRNLALVHCGEVIEFGLVRDGVPISDFSRRESWLSHICVKADGRRCYCGKYGCMENYATNSSRREFFNNCPNRAAAQRALGEMFGLAMVRLARKFPVEKIVFMAANDQFFNAEEYFNEHINSDAALIRHHTGPKAEYAAALMAAYFELHRYTGDE